MGEAFEIRAAARSDRREVAEMWRALIAHHGALDPTYVLPAGLEGALHDQVERAFDRADCGIWLAAAGDRAIGFALAEVEPGARAGDPGAAGSWVHELWVDPQWRRRGVASALVDRALDFLRERGRAAPNVRVEAANTAALRFWRARGFREHSHVLTLDDGPGAVPGGANTG